MAAGTITVNSEIRIEAPPDAVFPFLTDPQKIVEWKGVDATVEASPGGVYRVNVTGTNHAVGEYVEVDPPRRVVFTWGWEGDEQLPPGSSTVTIELIPDGDATIVRLTHSGSARGSRRGAARRDGSTSCRASPTVASGGDPGPGPLGRSPEQAETPLLARRRLTTATHQRDTVRHHDDWE